MTTSLGLNWYRKVKWLYTFITNTFINFDIKGNGFHESIAIQYSKIMMSLIQLVSSYMVTFKSGLFPQNQLLDLAFNEEYSIYKLIEAILYNDYPFD